MNHGGWHWNLLESGQVQPVCGPQMVVPRGSLSWVQRPAWPRMEGARPVPLEGGVGGKNWAAAGGRGWRHRPWWDPCPKCEGPPPLPLGQGLRGQRSRCLLGISENRVLPGPLSGALCSLKMKP